VPVDEGKDGRTIPGGIHAGKTGHILSTTAGCSLIHSRALPQNMWVLPTKEGVDAAWRR
jgi:hypothetical protein